MKEEYKDVHDFLRVKLVELKKEGNVIKSSNSYNAGTLKDELIELPHQFFCITSPAATVFNLESFRTTPWWMVSELLTEFLALNPPIMAKYSPTTIDQMYKLTPQGTCSYMYGIRWSEHNQIENIRRRLKANPSGKKCVIQTFMPYDSNPEAIDSPCNIGYMFLGRNGKLDMTATIRSNDIMRGTRYDYYLASFMQQSMASWVGMDIGKLYFHINSLHTYTKDEGELEKVLKELELTSAPAVSLEIPSGIECDVFWKQLRRLKDCEEASYNGNFGYFDDKLSKIEIPLFRDFARIYGIKNARAYQKSFLEARYRRDIEIPEVTTWLGDKKCT